MSAPGKSSPMDSALATVAERLRRANKLLEARGAQVNDSFRNLRSRVEAADSSMDESRQASSSEDGVDIAAIRQLLEERRINDLSVKQIRYIVHSPLEFLPSQVRLVLGSHPHLWRRISSALLSSWDVGTTERPAQWAGYRSMFDAAPAGTTPNYGPFAASVLLSDSAPHDVAERVQADTLIACERVLVSQWAFSARWSLTKLAEVEWLVRMSGQNQNTAPVIRLFCLGSDHGPLRDSLLPTMTRIGSPTIRVSRLAKQRTVALLLNCRFVRDQLGVDAFSVIEPRLVSGEFGDPRLAQTANDWPSIAALEPEGYSRFVESLIREDLAFFFNRFMNESDREEFWLRYVGTIERTLCVLDPTRRRELELTLTGAPEEVKSALDRAVSPRRGGQNRLSAFCLFFSNIVVVEFSDIANAAYIYEREWFTNTYLTAGVRLSIDQVIDLKTKGHTERIVHRDGWQQRARTQLWRDYKVY